MVEFFRRGRRFFHVLEPDARRFLGQRIVGVAHVLIQNAGDDAVLFHDGHRSRLPLDHFEDAFAQKIARGNFHARIGPDVAVVRLFEAKLDEDVVVIDHEPFRRRHRCHFCDFAHVKAHQLHGIARLQAAGILDVNVVGDFFEEPALAHRGVIEVVEKARH